MDLTNRVAIVTGAARGIGRAITTKLASVGVTVILIDVIEVELQSLTDSLINSGMNAEYFVLDIRDSDSITLLFESIKKKYGRVDILINNAAISPKSNGKRLKTHMVSLEEWEEVFKVNLTGAFLFTKNVLPMMKSNNWGRIVNISSVAGRAYSRIAGSHYAATKCAIIGFSRTVAAEYGKYGITVNNVAPGRIETPMAETATDEINSDYLKDIPLGKFGKSRDIAEIVLFLCSDFTEYITGETIDVNGGVFMK